MATITEDYVSFETAKLLKEKGFDEECSCFYNNIDYGMPGLEVDGQLYYKNSALDDEEYAAPTLQMALKWLREVHDIRVNIWYSNPNYAVEYFEPKTQTGVGKFVFIGDGYPSYEEAVEVALKYVLKNLI